MRPAVQAALPVEPIPLIEAGREKTPAALPENWYILAASREIGRGKIAVRKIGDRELVLFRTESGQVVAFDAHCAHMGCHLKHGKVLGETLRCALHFRSIDRSGRFLQPDGSSAAEPVQGSYPVEERFGAVFVYLGRHPRFPLPAPAAVAADELLARPVPPFRTAVPWHGLVANGCDMEHLLAVHGRTLKEPPVVARHDPQTFRIAYRTAVSGSSLGDRIMRRLSGNDIRASMTVIGGTTLLVESHAGPVPSLFLFSMCPEPDGGTLIRGLVGLRGRAGNPTDRLKLRLARWLFMSFLRKDFRVLDGLDWHPPAHPHSFGDRFSRQLFDYFCALAPAPPGRRMDGDRAIA